jgi:hypothetical protein
MQDRVKMLGGAQVRTENVIEMIRMKMKPAQRQYAGTVVTKAIHMPTVGVVKRRLRCD